MSVATPNWSACCRRTMCWLRAGACRRCERTSKRSEGSSHRILSPRFSFYRSRQRKNEAASETAAASNPHRRESPSRPTIWISLMTLTDNPSLLAARKHSVQKKHESKHLPFQFKSWMRICSESMQTPTTTTLKSEESIITTTRLWLGITSWLTVSLRSLRSLVTPVPLPPKLCIAKNFTENTSRTLSHPSSKG